MGDATPKAEFGIMGDATPKDDLGVEARDDLGEAGALPLGTGVCMTMAIPLGDLDRFLAIILGGSLAN